MGGHQSTRKSFGEVQEDLRRQIINNARSKLSNYGVWMGENSSLEDVLHRIASEQFRRSYGYEYSSAGYQCRPPNSLGDNRPIDKMCNIVMPIGNQVSDYLNAGVFSRLDLPRWMERQAIAELCGKAYDLVRWDTHLQWGHDQYSQNYDAKIEDTDSFICNSVLVYMHGSIMEDGITASSCILYFMGVYYKTESPTVKLRKSLQHRAYAASQGLLLGSLRYPEHDNQLQENLVLFCKEKFRLKFGFDYGDRHPPDSCRADGIDAAFLTQNAQLCYLPDLNTDGEITHYIDQNFFSGLNMPLASFKRAGLENTVTEFKNAMRSPSLNSWTTHFLDQTYKPASPSAHPVREKGVMVWWHTSEYARSGPLVTVTYISIMTMFYETLPPEEAAVKALFRLLCNNLCSRLHYAGHEEPSADEIALRDMLHEYAVRQFRQGHGFDYRGNKSEPPDRHNNKIKAFADLLHTQKHPPPDTDVESWLNAEVFEKGSMTFPTFANDTIWSDIRDFTIKCITESCSQEDWWFNTCKEHLYQNPSGGVGIKQYAVYVYACGEIYYEGVRVHRTFVYYLGVFCGVHPSKYYREYNDLL